MQRIAQDFGYILRGFRMMIDFNKLVFAFLGVVCSIIWVLTIIFIFSTLKLIHIDPFVLLNSTLLSPHLGLSNLFNVFLATMTTIDWAEYFALIILVIGLLAIWSFFGGAITRLAAMEFANDEKISFKEATSFAAKKFWSYFWSPLTPVIGILFFTACNILGGLFGQISYIGELAVAIGFPLAILSGFIIIFLAIIGTIGFFLMFPTISAEGSDTFDAISRSYSYVISRPMHFISLFVSIIICGAIFIIFISCIACLVMKTSFFTVGFGMGQKFDAIKAVVLGGTCCPTDGKSSMALLVSLPMKFIALMLMVYIALVKMFIGSLVISFAGSASTVAYFLLRKDVDDTELNDVYIEDGEDLSGKIREETREKTDEEKREEMKEDVKKEIRDEMKKEVNEAKEEVKRDVKAEVKKEVDEAKSEVKKDVKDEMKKEVNEVKEEVKRDVKVEVKKEVGEAKGQVKKDVEGEMKKEVNEAKEEVKRDVKVEVKKEVDGLKEIVKKEVKDEVGQEVKDKLMEEVKDIKQNIEKKSNTPEKPDKPSFEGPTQN